MKKNMKHKKDLQHNTNSGIVYESKDKAFAVASLICGLLFWIPLFNILLGPLALVFGIIQVRRIRQDPQRYGGQGYAIAGLTLGIICIVFTLMYYYSVFINQNFIPGINSSLIR